MKWGSGVLCMIGLPFAVLAIDRSAAAGQDYGAAVVRCESRDGGMTRCRMDTRNGVEMARQLSDSVCIRNSQWGLYGEGVWVTQGCRAEFVARRPATAVGDSRRVLRCESDGRQQSCPVNLRGAPVRLLRQLSALPCREGRSWGVRRNEIWVSRGCDGEFEIGAGDGSGFVDAPRILVCESKSRQRRNCGASIGHSAAMTRQLSGSPCEEGRSWGWNRNGVWVDKGCRAEFSVR